MALRQSILRPRFNPKMIAGIVHWWDANDSTTVTLVDGAISEWKSKAGTLSTASQTTANNRPTTTTVNGKTALLFDGTNDGLDFTGTARTDETWVLAAAQISQQTGTRAFINDAGDGHGINTTRTNNNHQIDSSWGGFNIGTERVLSANIFSESGLPASILSIARSTGTGIVLRRNGQQLATATTSASTTIKRIGYYESFLFQLNGWIGEIVCWNRALSADELLKVERYLGMKWGITVA